MERVGRLWMVTGEVLPAARNCSIRIKHLDYYPRNNRTYLLVDGKRHGNLSLKWLIQRVNSLTMDMVKEFTPWVIVNTKSLRSGR